MDAQLHERTVGIDAGATWDDHDRGEGFANRAAIQTAFRDGEFGCFGHFVRSEGSGFNELSRFDLSWRGRCRGQIVSDLCGGLRLTADRQICLT